MFLARGPGALCMRRRPAFGHFAYRLFTTKSHDPLRILFCGSDEFSIASLKALHDEHVKQPDRISSIDVVCRPGKKVGRGLKTIREVPIKAAATQLSLPIHEIDTFKGWTSPVLPEGPINLIIAVSFGLFVPPRILNGAKYGGLNVHPSLLPETGITLQTLHLKHFDHGAILQQTPPPGFEIPASCTVQELLDIVAPKGAEILVDGIRKGLFVPPVEEAGWRSTDSTETLIHATKIIPEDRHIDWTTWRAMDISRRNRVIGPLWSKALVATDHRPDKPSFQYRRVIFTDLEEVEPLDGCGSFALIPGLPFVDSGHPVEPHPSKGLYVFTRDGRLLRVQKMKVEGEQNTDALRAALKARMIGDKTFTSGNSQFTPFYNPLQ
ncbi:Methionyl-tRNA formyltransferase [Aspergillus nanangensis]|uniref:methionyl-tRNA formyltransferase n=1 Tax=Aspergillus nanangensis TaxID=2582783 RepID=A0AAD4CAJ0_ASPNN|nr:Methionyl-tRNA formyltransferase [Aspergillus nanangensis]